MIITETFERQKLYAFVADFLGSEGAQDVLDMACGDGEGTAILSGKGLTVTGVDISKKLITRASATYGEKAQFVVGDARRTDFPDNRFAGIVSSHTLEHFGAANQLLFLRELRRIVSPQGAIIISTPDRTVWHLQGIAGLQEDHVRELTRMEAETLFKEAGLRLERVFGQEFLKPEALRLRRFLNLIKKIDILKLRRLFPNRMIASIDEGTQPVTLTGDVKELRPGDLSSILIFVCRKA